MLYSFITLYWLVEVMNSLPRLTLSDEELIGKAHKLLAEGKPVAMAVIVNKVGSGPRRVGAKILVAPDGMVYGSLGGGPFERHVVSEALKAIREGRPRKIKYSFTGEEVGGAVNTGLICGGVVEVYIDVMKPSPRVAVFGVGRVGSPLAHLLKFLGFKVIIADVDEEVVSDELRAIAEEVIIASPDEVGLRLRRSLREGDVVVITHGDPETDFRVLKECLRSKASYVGLLGSKRKVAEFIKRLRSEGVDEDLILSKLRAPVGLSIGAETPEEISVSIASELIAFIKGASRITHSSVVEELLRS